MAFIIRTPKGTGYAVKHGSTGKTIKSFYGKGSKQRAEKHLRELHKRSKSKASNRGKSAKTKYLKRKKSKKAA